MSESVMQIPSQSSYERIYRRNFPFFVVDGVLFMVAMGIIGSTTLIPDFIRRLTDSEVLIGFSSSMFEIGWMIPQLFMARYLLRYARKKWWFIGPNLPVRFVMLAFAVITIMLGKDNPEAILIAFLVCYGIAAVGDGVVAVPWADLSGTSLDTRWRARTFGIQTAATGVIMLMIAPLIALILAGAEFPDNYAILFAIAGVLFALSTIPIFFIHELPGGKATEKVPSFREFIPELGHVLATDMQFRSILIARMLTSLYMMAGPFYIGFATVSLEMSSEVAVPTLLAVQTVGSVAGALLYTWMGARNNLMYIRLALFGGALWPVSALLAGVFGPVPLYFGFLISGLAAMNLMLGYQNWIVSYATPDKRPIYVGLFNTVAAVTSLAAPILGGTIAQSLGYLPLFAVSLVMAAIALFVTLRYVRNTTMPEDVEVTTVEAVIV